MRFTMQFLLLWLLATTADASMFAEVMRVHFLAAEICWKQKAVPSRKTVEIEIEAITTAAHRWWPEDVEETKVRLMALMLTEGGGRTTATPADPDRRAYGPLHVKLSEAIVAAGVFHLGDPYIEMNRRGATEWFESRLKSNVTFGIMCGAAHLKICDDEAGGDWRRGTMIYKLGPYRCKKLLEQGINISGLAVWKHFKLMTRWIKCLQRQVSDGVDDPCGCQRGP